MSPAEARALLGSTRCGRAHFGTVYYQVTVDKPSLATLEEMLTYVDELRAVHA